MTRVLIAIDGWVGSARNGEHQAVRDTWLRAGLPEGWDCLFFIGDGTPTREDESLVWRSLDRDSQPGYAIKAKESAKQQKPFDYSPLPDEIVLHVPDDFAHLAYKIRAHYRFAYAKGYDFVFQSAPDVYVALDRLVRDFASIEKHNRGDYIGKSVAGWYAGGGGHWLSRKAFRNLLEAPIKHWAADFWVGDVLRSRGIPLHPDSAYAADYPIVPTRDNAIICSHLGLHAGTFGKYDPQVMYDVHQQYQPSDTSLSGRDVVMGYAKGYDWQKIEPYAVSLARCGFRGHKVLLMDSLAPDAVAGLDSLGFTLVPCADFGLHPNVARLAHAASYLRDTLFRYAIWTDVRDVVFQSDPADWVTANIGANRIVAASECLLYRNEAWGDDNMRKCFNAEWMRDKVIYNCGVIAGRSDAMCSLFDTVYLMAKGANGSPADQAALNILLHATPWKEVTLVPRQEDGWATILGTTICRPEDFAAHLLEPIPTFEGGIVLAPRHKKEFCIVHQYDRTPWLTDIQAKYRRENAQMPNKGNYANAVEERIFGADYSNTTLFISTPMYGGQCSGLFHQSLLGLQRVLLQVGLHAAISDVWQEALITRARNNEADKMRASGMSHHLFIDADQGFHPNDILQMVLADKDIVCAPVAKKEINWKRVAEAVKKGWPPESLEHIAPDLNINTIEPVRFEGEIPQRVYHGGTGIMLIKRGVYDKMQEAFPEIEYTPMADEPVAYGDGKRLFAFFDGSIDPETNHYLSEDWTFCNRWRRIGGEVYLLPWLVTAHAGPYVYVGNAHAIATLQSGGAPSVVDADGNPVTTAA